jgi:hypothetical protein
MKIDTLDNSPVHLFDLYPKEIENNFNWIASIDAWDYCDPKPLSEMLMNHPIPNQKIRNIVASIINGTRKQNTKGAAKLKTIAAERMIIATCILSLRRISRGILNNPESYKVVADEKGIEITEMRREIERKNRKTDKMISNRLEINEYSIKTLIQHFHDTLKKYT